jgi:hypothetical protein
MLRCTSRTTGRNRLYVYSWVGAFLYVIVSNHAGANSSPWNPPPGGNPGLKRTRTGATFKTCVVKTPFKLKINLSNETICRPYQSGETIPLTGSSVIININNNKISCVWAPYLDKFRRHFPSGAHHGQTLKSKNSIRKRTFKSKRTRSWCVEM